jgi:hypothetical protein
MLWVERIRTARISFRDREGTTDAIELLYALDSDLDALLGALRDTNVFQAVSECTQCAVSLTATQTRLDAAVASGLNLDMGALIFQTAAETYGTILVPGLKTNLLQSSGCFAGYGLETSNIVVQGCAQSIVDAGVCTPRQDAFTHLVAGGLWQQWSEMERSSG